MRKIEQAMLAAIRDKRDWHDGNTLVRYECGIMTDKHVRAESSRVYLHGHHIATVYHDADLAGRYPVGVANHETFRRWPTALSASRLRALGITASIKQGVYRRTARVACWLYSQLNLRMTYK